MYVKSSWALQTNKHSCLAGGGASPQQGGVGSICSVDAHLRFFVTTINMFIYLTNISITNVGNNYIISYS